MQDETGQDDSKNLLIGPDHGGYQVGLEMMNDLRDHLFGLSHILGPEEDPGGGDYMKRKEYGQKPGKGVHPAQGLIGAVDLFPDPSP